MLSCASGFAEVQLRRVDGRAQRKWANWVVGERSDRFHSIVRRHGKLRKFSPALLNAFDFIQDADGALSGCPRALQMLKLKEMKADGRRKLPADDRRFDALTLSQCL